MKMVCPNCGFDSPLEMRFCGRCGVALKQVCSTCNFANPLDYNFCGRCGTSLPVVPVADKVEGRGPSRTRTLRTTAASPPQIQPASNPTSPSQVEPVVSVPTPEHRPLEGERRAVTVILADVVKSTDLLEQLGTEAWVEMMNHVFQLLEAEIYRLGGTVDQFRGDGLVALFGAASAHEDDPERAVLASLAMQDAIKTYATELAQDKNITLQIRVGVNTGEVIVASIGDQRQYQEDTAMGEAVALAARMETAAQPGTVLVSKNCYDLTQLQFEWQPLGEITVKGINQPVAVYQPVALREDAKPLRRLHLYGLKTPLIGREAEFKMLEANLQQLQAGRGGIVMVMGDKGVGKSQLVNEVRQHLKVNALLLAEALDREGHPTAAAPHPPTWLQGRSRSYNQAQPYSMWLALLWNWLGGYENEPDRETSECLYQEAQVLWGDQLLDYYPYLAKFLSLPLEEIHHDRIKHLDAEGLHQQFYRTIRSWVEALARREPLVLGFGDIHWADVTSLNLLEYCLPLTDQAPILWLITLRPDRASAAWDFCHRLETDYPHRLTSLNLPPLSEAQSGEMIDQLVGPDALPAETRALILNKAEGNPYYLEELVRSLIEQGVLIQDVSSGKWQATRTVTSLDYLPDTLQSLLLARIGTLSAKERRVLQLAAVIGSVFWSDILQALFDDEAQLRDYLTGLQRAQLIYERGQVPELGMEYVFKSNLIRDAAYESILSNQRIRNHHQIAEYLRRHFKQEASAHYYGMLAHHYRQAKAATEELHYTILAAQQAQQVYANVEAIELYNHALELLQRLETQTTDEARLYNIRTQQFEVLDGRREVYRVIGNITASRIDAQALLPLARQLDDDPTWLIDALLQQPGVTNWLDTAELRTGLQLSEEALSLTRRLGDRHREMRSLITIAEQRLYLGDLKALSCAEQALELARQLNDQYYEAHILIGMSRHFSWSNEPERGMDYLKAALPIAKTLDDKLAELELLSQIGFQFERYGDYYRVLTEYQEPRLSISREIGHRPLEAQSLLKCAEIKGIYLGDYEASLRLIEEAKAIWAGASGERHPYLRNTQISLMQAEHDRALEFLKQAQQVRVRASSDISQAGLYLVSAMVYNAFGDEMQAHRVLTYVEKLYRLSAETPFLTQQFNMAAACQATVAHLTLAQHEVDEATRQKHHRLALEASQSALEIYERFGFAQIIECVSEEVLFRHSQALAANNRTAEAADYLTQAHQEMMRKHDMLPSESAYRPMFLENIPLHRDIRKAFIG